MATSRRKLGQCTAPDCGRDAVSKDMCFMHYKRMRKHGSLEKHELRRPLAERFAGRYEIDLSTGCWIWSGPKDPKGYGSIGSGGLGSCRLGAHRVSYEIHVGPIPAEMCVCHRCDVPACVNPEHLFLGTIGDNNRDMWSKGRGKGSLSPEARALAHKNVARGEKHPQAKLCVNDIIEIRRLATAGVRGSEIARQFRVTHTNICRVVQRQIWKEVA